MIRRTTLAFAAACLLAAGVAPAQDAGPAARDASEKPADVFPFPVHGTTLDNGLEVVVIPYDSPGVVAYFTVVRAGSRQEVEAGHSGFAHFFEHMMFRGTQRYSQTAYNDVLRRMGADSNAFTTDDYTNYYVIGPAAELETMMDVESDRFKNLEYSEDAFRTEALAVLGEYNKNASNPFLPMYEKLRDLAFDAHTYEHTTLGFLEDIEAMPGYYDYSLQFFDRYYRPENVVLLIVGDVEPQAVHAMAKEYYGDWEKGYQAAAIAAEPEPEEGATAQLDWPNPTRPHLMVGYRTPAFDPASTDVAALDLVEQLLFSDAAPLYQRLVVEEQWVDQLSGSAPWHRDPYLFMVFARVKSDDLLPAVETALGEAIAELQETPVDAARLERVKSHLRYDYALGLDSAGAVAFSAARMLQLTGRVEPLNTLYATYEKVTPQDVQRVAKTYFQPQRRTLVRLTYAPPEPEAEENAAVETVTLPSPGSPLVAVRLLFDVGSIHDPAGKEGLAALTGRMVAEAATAERSYAELVDALYPMAAQIEVTTDREVTLVSGVVHRDTLERYTALLLEALLTPGFAAADLERHKGELEAYLTTTLRSSDDELLGLETTQQEIFDGHPYGHAPAGTVQGLAAVTMDDVKSFYRRHYTRANLLLGVAGGYPEGYVAGLVEKLAALPAGEGGRKKLPAPPEVEGRTFTLVEKNTGSVGIHFGYPLLVNRADDAYYPLMVANSFLGEHRTFHGRLMQQLRGERGLNYGDYSYVEHWHAPPFTSSPTPNVPRRQQYVSVWVRPVRPETAHFALRAALHEVDRLRQEGLSEAEFELTRDFLVNYTKLWAQTLSDRLGFHMDSRFYGMPYYIDHVEDRLGALSREEVNRAIRKYLHTDAYEAVLVTADAAKVKAWLEADEPSPMTYGSEVPAEILKADEVIEKRKVRPTAIDIVPVEEMFER